MIRSHSPLHSWLGGERLAPRRARAAGIVFGYACRFGLPLFLLAFAALGQTPVVTVDASQDSGPVLHRGSGFLHYGATATPPLDQLRPLTPRLLRNGSRIASKIYDTATVLGAQVQAVLSDVSGYQSPWPGDGGDYSSWENLVYAIVQQAHANGQFLQWDVWNEPYFPPPLSQAGNPYWQRDRAQWFETWRRAVVQIRAADLNAVVVGPSIALFDSGFLTDFLSFCQANNVVPDVLSWHFGQVGQATVQVNQARTLVQSLGLSITRFQVNEFADPRDWLNPGLLVQHFADLERAKVDGAIKACWPDPDYSNQSSCFIDTLDGLLRPTSRLPRSAWWAWKVYGDMAGRLLAVSPTPGVDGLASYDEQKQEIRVLIGANQAGNVVLRVARLTVFPELVGGGTVRVKVESIPNTDTNELLSPVLTDYRDYPLDGDELRITLPGVAASEARSITIMQAGTREPVAKIAPGARRLPRKLSPR